MSHLIIHEKKYSPDSLKYLIRFSYDQGALGSCCNQTSILNISDSISILTKHILPSSFQNPRWVNNHEINVDIHMIQLLTSKGNNDPSFPELNIKNINNINITKQYFNQVDENDIMEIKFSKISPDKKHILLGYKYQKDKSVLHVSTYPINAKIPRYGNLYILNPMYFDGMVSFEWINNDSIQILLHQKNIDQKLKFGEITNTKNHPEIIKRLKKIMIY